MNCFDPEFRFSPCILSAWGGGGGGGGTIAYTSYATLGNYCKVCFQRNQVKLEASALYTGSPSNEVPYKGLYGITVV